MKKINIISVFVLLLIFGGCQQMDPKETINQGNAEISIARLLDRSEQIQMSQEWDQVQNNYAKLKNRLTLDPTDVDAALKLVLLFTQEARVTGEHGHYYPAAMHILADLEKEEVELSQDEEFFALCLRSGVLMSLHQFEKALKVAQNAVQLNPYNAQIYGVLVDANVELGNYDEAVKAADKMVSIRPDLRSYARVSYLRQIFGDMPGAIEAMKMAVSAGFPPYEETSWARYQLAKLYEATSDYETARVLYNQILGDRPGYPFAVAAIAHLERMDGNPERAIELYDEAILAIPEVSFYVDKAEILYGLNLNAEADSIMNEVFLMIKDDEKSGHNMDLYSSQIYSEVLDNQDKALEFALKEYETRPLNIEVNKRLALIYARLGDMKSTRLHLDLALRTDVDDAELKELQEKLKMES